ncbi:DUF192 domain-containing protein [Candidatus Nanohaloarchaea archaeon]|nr:DUF192 domain-containing protein [Candidatus Nanohaloarchaea archaeon]
MDRKIVFLIGLSLIATGVLVSSTGDKQDASTVETVNASFAGSSGAWAVLEIADNSSERERGLMYRKELGRHQGMLFVFKKEAPRAFWMKNTYIPLDMMFLNSDREIINIETAYPQPNTSEENLKLYRSERPAKYVIEVNAGFADNYSIEEGSKVKWGK